MERPAFSVTTTAPWSRPSDGSGNYDEKTAGRRWRATSPPSGWWPNTWISTRSWPSPEARTSGNDPSVASTGEDVDDPDDHEHHDHEDRQLENEEDQAGDHLQSPQHNEDGTDDAGGHQHCVKDTDPGALLPLDVAHGLSS